MQVAKKIREINRKNKVDIVHYTNLCGFALFANKKIPYVIRISSFMNIFDGGARTINGSVEYEDNNLSIKHRMDERAMKRSKYVISPSNLLADICNKNLGINSTVLESPFVLDNKNWDYSIYNTYCKDKKYILHFGTQSYLKGTHMVSELVHPLMKKYEEILLVCIGKNNMLFDENNKEIKAQDLIIKRAKEFKNRVICMEKIPREQLYPFIHNAEICLLPSRIENLSNACIEAMALGRVVVATNGASYEQLIDNGVSGFLCERDNYESFLQGIELALALSEEEKEKMKEKAIERTNKLKPEKVYEKYNNFYTKVIKEW